MGDLLATITNITDGRDFPHRRETFIAPTPVQVLVWKVISRDPDENEDHYGALVDYNDEMITILLAGDAYPTDYRRFTNAGVELFRMKTVRS